VATTITHVVGARPNFMKAARVIHALKETGGVRQAMVHTGQDATRPPDQPRVLRALEAMLEEINRRDGRLFGDGPNLTFVVTAD